MGSEALIRITSWNVANGVAPPTSTLNYIFDEQEQKFGNLKPDIQAIGFQECYSGPWDQPLSEFLGKKGYVLAKSHHIGGIFLYIYVLRELIYRVRDFETESVRTGFGGIMANKGGVSLRFNLNGNSICITNSHLEAHQEELAKRIEDYHSILAGTKFLIDQKNTGILQHEYAFWFGDLNFRFDNISKDNVLNVITNVRLSGSPEEQEKFLASLYKNDQLTTSRGKNQLFSGFNETLPKFLPTYKFKIDTKNEYNADKRIPAWTDRILFRNLSAPHDDEDGKFRLRLEQLAYDSIPETTSSDHKPVFSIFKVATHERKDVDKDGIPLEIIKFLPIAGWKAGEDGHLWYKIENELFNHERKLLGSWDKIALYQSNFTSLENEQTFVYVNNLARVSPRLDAPTVAYRSSPPSSRPESPSSTRRASLLEARQAATVAVATEAITLNSTLSSTATTTSRPGTKDNISPIVEDGFKYFHATFPDDALIPGQSYIVLYLQNNHKTNEYNVLGMSESFDVKY